MSYKLVQLRNGTHAVYAAAYDEKMHPGLGPAAEAEEVYVRQLKLRERLRDHSGEFVIWDIGLGAAANATAALRAAREFNCPIRLVSFDDTTGPLEFALQNISALEYLQGYEAPLAELLQLQGRAANKNLEVETRKAPHPACGHPLPIRWGEGRGEGTQRSCVEFKDGSAPVTWEFYLGDFPAFLTRSSRGNSALIETGNQSEPPHVGCYIPPPHAIMFDAFSPAKNPAMWTLPLFTNLFRALDPQRPCALTTYSRSTMLRVTLLLAGFFVGRGVPTGLKEETTVAANSLALLDAPLDRRWLERARRSDSAEPLREPIYSRAPLSLECWEQLLAHPQFKP